MNRFEENARSLAARSLACREQLKKLSCLSQDDQQPDAWARDQAAQFNMWAANAGVFAEMHRSLDFRLKDIPETRELIALLLQALEKDIIRSQAPLEPVHQLYNPLSCEIGNSDETNDDSSISTYDFLSSSEEADAPIAPISESRVAIQETIDRLHRLAAIIKRSGKKHRQLRMERYLDKPKNREVHDTIKMYALQKVDHLFPAASKVLRERMAESIARRRSRVSYIKQHQQKKFSTTNYTLPAPQPPLIYEEPNTSPQLPYQDIESTDLVRPQILEPLVDASTTLSVTEDTKLDPKRLRAIREDRPETVVSVYLSQGGFPNPPKVHSTDISFLCPYCYLECPIEEARGKFWRQHVIRDFEPFFCVSDDCKHPFELSDSFSGFITHLQEEHMPPRWHCTAPIHESKIFSEKEEFEEHMRTHHEPLTDLLLSTLTKHSVSHETRVFQSCPFCGGLPEELETEFPDQQDTKAQEAFQRHIKDHLVSVALILPPILVDTVEEEDRSGGSSTQGHGDSAFNPEEEIVTPFILCERGDQEKPCDCRDGTKDSTAEWLTMSGIVLPIWGESRSMASLEHFFDPAWPSDPLSTLLEPEEKWKLLVNPQPISIIKAEWKPCKNISLPPVRKDITTKYEGHLNDDKLVSFVKRYHELKANDDSIESEYLPYGLKELANGVDSSLDIVAIHGLNGHREKTWTAVNDINWLRDFLPSDIPNARILTWGYDANTQSTSQTSAQYLYDHARTLVSDLCLKRSLTKTRTRPIIFVAHSLGGIVVKLVGAMIHSDAARQGALDDRRYIKLSTYGIFFMGTPHQGDSGAHLGELMLKVASVFGIADDNSLRRLERDSEWLQQQLGQYGLISRDFVTRFAYETQPTRVTLGKGFLVVPKASANIPGISDAECVAITADHLNMVKFTSCDDGGYEKISGHLKLLAEEAPDAISVRWAEQDKIREALSKPDKDFSVPFSSSGVPEVEIFVGRDEELFKIKGEFQGSEPHRRIVVLQGLGGIGKTQLAVTFIKQQRDAFSAVFWLNGKNKDMLKQGFADMARRLYNGYPSSMLLRTAAESKDADQIVGAMKRWLSIKGNIHWMLVFDNIDYPKLPGIKDPQAIDIKSYFPEAHQGCILITTRSSRLNFGKVIHVKKLRDTRESIAILAHMSERQISDQDPHVLELVEKLDGLPLALATAGAYLSQVSTSLADYLLHYSSSWLELQETSPELESYEDRALYSTWNTSYQHINSQNESAGKLLQLWGYFDRQDLWYSLLAGGTESSPEWFSSIMSDELSFNKVMRLLCDHDLIESRRASGGYGMHSCVHAWTRHALNPERDISMIELAFRCVGSAVPDETVFQYWALQKRLLPHANRCLISINDDLLINSKNSDRILSAAHHLGNLFANQGKMREAEKMYLWALTGYEKAWGAEHTSTLRTVNNLGNLYSALGKRKEAEEMYLRALTGYEKAWGAEHISTLNTVHNLGRLYSDQGKMDEAEEMCLRALIGYEKTWGAEHTSTLSTVNSLGLLYSKKGEITEAEEMYLRALTGYEKAWGPEHPSTLNIVNNLGLLYSEKGKMKEAEAMYLRALAGYEKAWGAEHTSTLRTVNKLGNLFSAQGMIKEAEAMYLRALAGYEKAWGAEHVSTVRTVNKLGNLFSAQGMIKEAEAMYLRALTGYEKAWGPEHPSTLNIVNNLGLLYLEQGKMKEAESMYLRALAGYEKAWGAEHTSTLDIVHNLGRLYSDQGKMEEAKEMFLRALFGYGKTWGAEHTSTLSTVNNLGFLYSNEGKLKEAEIMYLRALAGEVKVLGPEHTSTLKTVNNLGLLYSNQGKAKEAEAMYLRALAGYEKARGAEHTSTLDTVHNLGRLYSDQGKMEEAEAMYLRALVGYEEALGAEHTSTLDTVHNLGRLYSDQGKMKEAEAMYLRALAGYEKTCGHEYEGSLDTRYNMAMLYASQSSFEAKEQLECVVQGYINTLGPEHEKTIDAINQLEKLHKRSGKTRRKFINLFRSGSSSR